MYMADSLAVVVAAAGIGSRMGSKINKQFLLLNSKPILSYSLGLLEQLTFVDQVVLVAHPNEVEYCQRELVQALKLSKITAVVAGGATRQMSVWNGMQVVDKETDLIAIHDGARPLATEALFLRLLKAAREWGAAIPGVRARDTVKMIDGDGFVVRTLDRNMTVNIQTPQAFRYTELMEAYQMAREDQIEASDDAALFERYIGRVKVVEGEYANLKITTQEDLIIAEGLLKFRGAE